MQTRHSFCVICGADLKDVPAETPLQTVAAKASAAGKRVQAVLTTPIGVPKQDADRKAVAETQETEPAVQNPAEPAAPQDDRAVIPDFMRQFLT